jgi:hypothetical protein
MASGFSGNASPSDLEREPLKGTIDDRFLVRERIPIDPAVLCDIVERLFGLAIMIGKYSVGLHGVLLPRSWVLALWQDFTDFKDREQAPFWVLAQETERLLRGIYSGDYLSDTIDFGEFDQYPADVAERHLAGSQDLKNKTTNWSNDLPRKFLQDLCVSRMSVYLFQFSALLRADVRLK